MKKDKNLCLRSPQVQEIIGQVPPWLIRWGLTAVFVVIVVLFCLSWFVRYPKTATATVVIKPTATIATTDNLASGKFIAEGFLDERYFHNIEPGQAAQIKLISSSFYDYGVLKGTVTEKSSVSHQGKFKIIILLPEGLLTTHHRAIAYYENMSGTAEIIVENSRLINRMFNSFSGKSAKSTKRQ
jgi:hypothetical protein